MFTTNEFCKHMTVVVMKKRKLINCVFENEYYFGNKNMCLGSSFDSIAIFCVLRFVMHIICACAIVHMIYLPQYVYIDRI